MTEFKNIVMTTDLSDKSWEALPMTVSLAEKVGGTVTLVTVVEPAFLVSGFHAPVMVQDYEGLVDNLSKIARTTLDEKIAELDTSVPIKAVVTDAMQPAAEIIEQLEKLDADLVVVATHGRTGIGHVLIGSTAERIVRTSDVPVLTVRDGKMTAAFEKIAVTTDLSDCSAAALEPAIALAREFGCELDILSVIAPIPDPTDLSWAVTASKLSEIPERRRKTTEEKIGALIEGMTEGIPTKITVTEAENSTREIVRLTEELGADLIVVATHGRSGVSHMIHGSTAEKIVRTSPVPVLSIRATTEAEKTTSTV